MSEKLLKALPASRVSPSQGLRECLDWIQELDAKRFKAAKLLRSRQETKRNHKSRKKRG